MDIEKLIEQLSARGLGNGTSLGYHSGLLDEVATALSTIQAENEKLRVELEKVKRALAMMWFAYMNSDKESPHSYETEALEEAERLLGPWEECMTKYLRRGPKED